MCPLSPFYYEKHGLPPRAPPALTDISNSCLISSRRLLRSSSPSCHSTFSASRPPPFVASFTCTGNSNQPKPLPPCRPFDQLHSLATLADLSGANWLAGCLVGWSAGRPCLSRLRDGWLFSSSFFYLFLSHFLSGWNGCASTPSSAWIPMDCPVLSFTSSAIHPVQISHTQYMHHNVFHTTIPRRVVGGAQGCLHPCMSPRPAPAPSGR